MRGQEKPGEAWPELTKTTKTIVVVDLVESVRLMQLDEAGVINRWRRFVHEVRSQVLPSLGGRMVKSLGDGMLLEFDTPTAGVAAALQLQPRIDGLAPQPAVPLSVRVGVHSCEVVRDEHDIYGPGVNLSARIAGLAAPGEVVASMTLAEQLIVGIDADIEDIGECWLKHLDQPVRCARLRPCGISPKAPPEARSESGAPSALTERVQARIAVLGFELRGAAQAFDQVIGELIAEGLIAQLSRSAELQVISHLSTRRLGAHQLAPAEVAALTGASYILCGSVLLSGELLLIHGELLEARSAAVVWAERQRCSRADLLMVPSPPLSHLANLAHEAILKTEAQRALTQPLPTLEGYSLLTGSVGLLYRSTERDFLRAREALELLAERVPRHGAAYAWLAKWHFLRIVRGQTGSPQRERQEAAWRAEQSLERDSTSSVAWALRGLVHGFLDKDLSQADHAYTQALSHNPNEALAWLFTATLRSWQGRGAEAAAAASQALDLAPLDPMRYYYESLAAAGFLANGQHDRAQALCRSSLLLNRGHTPTYRVLAIAQMLGGDAAGAHDTVQQMLSFEPDLTVGKYLSRYPGAGQSHARVYADALREAGLPD